jgi:hypothetical protein
VRAVVDTNVLLSGLFWRGKPHALIEQVRAGALNLISSPGLLAKLAEVMPRPKFEAAGSVGDGDMPPQRKTTGTLQINLEFYGFNDQLSDEIYFSSLTSVRTKWFSYRRSK